MIRKIGNALAIILTSLLVTAGANGALWQWSKTTSTNSTADPSINWSEGMSPSSVNDSARAMMARVAEYRDDISGSLATGGTSTAYTVTTNQGLNATPNDGQLIAITPHTTNGIAATLAADSGTAYPIQTAAGTAVASGVLVQGTPYSLKFVSSSSAWVLHSFFGNPYSTALGAYMWSTDSTPPNSNFVLPYGQCISRSVYAAYFAKVGTTYGACDGVNNFAVPDVRGRMFAAPDNMGGSSANRLTTTYFGSDPTVAGNTGGNQRTALVAANIPSVPLTGTGTPTVNSRPAHAVADNASVTAFNGGVATNTFPESQFGTISISVAGTTTAGADPNVTVVPPAIITYVFLRVL